MGYSEGVNCGIARSVKGGLIGSVGVMVNMPSARHGLNLLKGMIVCYGQHTNICIGKPLTDPTLIPSITDGNGNFKTSKSYRSAKTDFVVFDEVILEIEAPYKQFVELVGEPPHYFEGHAVASDNFSKGLEIVASQYNLKYSGFSVDGTPLQIARTHVRVQMESMATDYVSFDSLRRHVESSPENSCLMFICHPGYLDSYILKHSSLTTPSPLEVEMLCDPDTKKWLENSKVQLITYDDL